MTTKEYGLYPEREKRASSSETSDITPPHSKDATKTQPRTGSTHAGSTDLTITRHLPVPLDDKRKLSLLDEVTQGIEMQPIGCRKEIDYVHGRLTVTRIDTGEILEDRALEEEEEDMQQ